jgi:hypothetical protein
MRARGVPYLPVLEMRESNEPVPTKRCASALRQGTAGAPTLSVGRVPRRKGSLVRQEASGHDRGSHIERGSRAASRPLTTGI